jgi:hypothetical protein
MVFEIEEELKGGRDLGKKRRVMAGTSSLYGCTSLNDGSYPA